MGVTPMIKPAGLFTDPNPLSAVPHGALREALNVVIRRDGVVEPRPGFREQTIQEGEGGPVVTGDPQRLIPWNGSVLYISDDGAWFVNPLTGELLSPTQDYVAGLSFGTLGAGYAARAVTTRENLYLTCDDGVRKVTSPESDEGPPAGAFGQSLVITLGYGASGGFLPTGRQVAYRATLQKRDENEVVVTSAPTSRSLITGGGSPTDVDVRVELPPADVSAGDVVQFWRSVSTETFAPDDLFLAFSYNVTAADLVAGFFAFTDTATDAQLGAALYTNDDQEGALQANDPPPRVQDLALFRGSVFGADITGRKRVLLTWIATADFIVPADTDKAGFRVADGDITNLSDTITNVIDTSGIEVGSLITGAHAGLPPGATVLATTPTTIQMSAVATATAAGVTIFASDVIQFDGDSFSVANPQTLVAAINIGTVNGVRYSASGDPSANYRAYLITDFDTQESIDVLATVVIEPLRPGFATALGLNSTKPGWFQPELGDLGDTYTEDASYVDLNDIINGLIYSKTDQPESFPATNVIRVGSSSYRIDRIVATKDALWIFKRDGIFRLTGNGAGYGSDGATWRVDPFDMTHFLVASDSALTIDNAVYAWTNRGVVRITDAGIQQISALAIGDQLGEIERLAGINPLNSYTSTVLKTGWAIANLKNDEYILATPGFVDDALGEAVEYLYVYNTKTLAWTRWATAYDELTHGCIVGTTGTIALAVEDEAGEPSLMNERTLSDGNDGSTSFDRVIVPGSFFPPTSLGDNLWTVELDAPIDIDFTVGSLVTFDTGAVAIVREVSDASPDQEVTVYTLSDLSEEDTITAIAEAFPEAVEFVAQIDAAPNAEKMWRDGVISFGATAQLESFEASFTSSLRGPSSSFRVRADGWPTNTDGGAWSARFLVSRNHARSSILFPRIDINNAGAMWSIWGVTLTGAQHSALVRR